MVRTASQHMFDLPIFFLSVRTQALLSAFMGPDRADTCGCLPAADPEFQNFCKVDSRCQWNPLKCVCTRFASVADFFFPRRYPSGSELYDEVQMALTADPELFGRLNLMEQPDFACLMGSFFYDVYARDPAAMDGMEGIKALGATMAKLLASGSGGGSGSGAADVSVLGEGRRQRRMQSLNESITSASSSILDEVLESDALGGLSDMQHEIDDLGANGHLAGGAGAQSFFTDVSAERREMLINTVFGKKMDEVYGLVCALDTATGRDADSCNRRPGCAWQSRMDAEVGGILRTVSIAVSAGGGGSSAAFPAWTTADFESVALGPDVYLDSWAERGVCWSDTEATTQAMEFSEVFCLRDDGTGAPPADFLAQRDKFARVMGSAHIQSLLHGVPFLDKRFSASNPTTKFSAAALSFGSPLKGYAFPTDQDASRVVDWFQRTAKGSTWTPASPPECVDYPEWESASGVTCDSLEHFNTEVLCAPESDGVGANDACCVCGGGNRLVSLGGAPADSWSHIYGPRRQDLPPLQQGGAVRSFLEETGDSERDVRVSFVLEADVFEEIFRILMGDALLIVISLLAVAFYMWFKTGSMWITAFGMLGKLSFQPCRPFLFQLPTF